MFYEYDVTVWDTYDSNETSERGITYAKDYGEAANRIVEYYGAEYVISMSITEWDNELCLPLSDIKAGFKLS